VSTLRSVTQGRADFTMTLARYAPLPKALWAKALEQA
jgi:translation elongation factor EF-G